MTKYRDKALLISWLFTSSFILTTSTVKPGKTFVEEYIFGAFCIKVKLSLATCFASGLTKKGTGLKYKISFSRGVLFFHL